MKSIQEEIKFWSKIYRFNFQFWPDQNNVYINKKDALGEVELASFGSMDTPEEIQHKACEWCRKVNPVRYREFQELPKLETSEFWQKKQFGDLVFVMDSDGWDGKNYEYSWHVELISEDEFNRRFMLSTVYKG